MLNLTTNRRWGRVETNIKQIIYLFLKTFTALVGLSVYGNEYISKTLHTNITKCIWKETCGTFDRKPLQ